MKKSKVILLCVVAVLVAAIIIGAVVFFRSPHYALSQMKKAISDYLKVLFDANPKAVGGALPGDDFYYGE